MMKYQDNGEIFRILFLSLPRVVYDRNLHDRCTDFGETAAYIIDRYRENPGVSVEIADASVPCATLRMLYRYFAGKYNVIVFFTDITDAPLVLKLCKALRYISPETRHIIYGDSTLTIPQFFFRRPFDAVHINGDQEAAIYSFIEYVRSGDKTRLKSVALISGEQAEMHDEDVRIPPEEWALPPVDLLPIDEYKKFAALYKKSSYACSIYVSKGCSNKCNYCLCWRREGCADRRRSPEVVADFIEKYADRFELFKLHSADFMSDKEWVEEFCKTVISRKIKFNWKTTVCFKSMDTDLVGLCAEAGCVGLGFGIETFYRDRENGMKISVPLFKDVMSKLSKYNIKYKGFIMIGINDQTLSDVHYTIDILQSCNIKVRPSTYTPYYMLMDKSAEELDAIGLERWDKKEAFRLTNDQIDEKEVYEILASCQF